MSDQMSLFAAPVSGYGSDRGRRSYVRNRQERPADIPKLERSAETMEARVLEWFAGKFGVLGYKAQTPTMCAEGLGAKLTTIRPRITQLLDRKSGPRLERCAWLPRRPTEDGGSEGWVRFTEAEEKR